MFLIFLVFLLETNDLNQIAFVLNDGPEFFFDENLERKLVEAELVDDDLRFEIFQGILEDLEKVGSDKASFENL